MKVQLISVFPSQGAYRTFSHTTLFAVYQLPWMGGRIFKSDILLITVSIAFKCGILLLEMYLKCVWNLKQKTYIWISKAQQPHTTKGLSPKNDWPLLLQYKSASKTTSCLIGMYIYNYFSFLKVKWQSQLLIAWIN